MSSPVNSSASGFCAACRTVHSLGEGNSRQYAVELMRLMEKYERIDFPQEWTPPSPATSHPPPATCHPPPATLPLPLATCPPPLATSLLFSESRGHMFGVLECEDAAGNTVVLKAFSGQYNGQWLVDGWVPPILDVNEFYRLSDPVDKEIKQLDRMIAAEKDPGLIRKRKALSQELMKALHALYQLTNFHGETRALTDVFQGGIPTGAGDCCAPKLLNYAALHGLKPRGLSEFYWGRENRSGTRQHKQFYSACAEKCQPILGFMLCGKEELPTNHPARQSSNQLKTQRHQGHGALSSLCLERSGCLKKHLKNKSFSDSSTKGSQKEIQVIFEDPEFVVANKPSGLLAVPGKGEENRDCVAARIRALYPECIEQPAVHRLDMDTSGLMVLALTADAHRNLSRQFHDRKTEKRYITLLDGELKEDSGTIELPFRLDVENRPFQIYDPVQGKVGITHWKKLRIENKQTRVEFFPITGRTHQLRVHAASKHGLGIPIVGDRLYGTGTAPGQLKLHASFLSFTHPRTGEKMEFRADPPF